MPPHTTDRAYLATLRQTLDSVLEGFEPELVLYDAGVDVWEGDQLGYLGLTHAGM